MDDYRQAVKDYHRANGSEDKNRLRKLIARIKGGFRSYIRA
jgi:hypothetical protein